MIMTRTPETYYAKIMLFGEYSVIFNSMGLTIPYVHFKGAFRFINDEQYTDYEFAQESNRQLERFAVHLRKLNGDQRFRGIFDTGRLDGDIRQGLYFESSIPQGYGIGSSGALCAAVYHCYALDPVRLGKVMVQEDILQLKSIFSAMESFFHGQSSGLDPLLCYIRQPLLLTENGTFNIVRIPRRQFQTGGAIFLIDTGRQGKTEPLVKLFREKTKDASYLAMVKEQLIPVTHACINTLLKDDPTGFYENLKKLSGIQLHHFTEMISPDFMEMWQYGLESDNFYLKLCGSGGGGFLLGMTHSLNRTKEALQHFHTDPVMVY
jgi:mevalonate kinase